MVLQVLVFLLVVCPLLSGAALASRLAPSPTLLLTRRSQAQHTPPSAQARCPDDCPACRLASPAASSGGPVPASVRPWREVKSRWGAPKRVNTEGFACPNPQCAYWGITDAQVHATFWGWHAWPCRTDPDLSLSGLPHHLQCATPHPVVPAENPRAPDPPWCSLHWPKGWTSLPQSGSSAIVRPPSLPGSHTLASTPGRSTSAPFAPSISPTSNWTNSTQILWLWLAIDPLTKIIPVLQLGPRTQHRAHLMIHSLRLMLAPGCLLSSIGFLGGREGKDTSICYDEDMNINPHQQGESSCLARIDYRHGSRKCQPPSRI